MLLCLLFFGTVLALPADEFRTIVEEGDLALHNDASLKHIVPARFTPLMFSKNSDESSTIPNVDDKGNEYFKTFFSFVENGVTAKGLIFNVYEDDMRDAAIALFRLLRETRLYNRIDYDKIKEWAEKNVNDDMYDYARRLTALYSNSYVSEDKFLPPFYLKPNYFINGETIVKGFYLKNNYGKVSESFLNNYQAKDKGDGIIVLNSNYSGWNIPLNGCDEQISYFKDDVGLNSYYYGKQLLHPFWMSNEELDEINPQHAEHYYFTHQQLLARYRLEKEHLGAKILEELSSKCESGYNPYLYYENGLAFPTRSSILGELDESLTYKIKSVDIAIKECIHRGLVVMENGTFIKVTSENYINLMTKLIRANLDGIKSAKILRSIFGYGNSGYPINKSNPTPSALHHPQTTLRDPIYWRLIERGLDYFSEYTNQTGFDLSEDETDEFNITVPDNFKITTTFQDSLFSLRRALGNSDEFSDQKDVNIFARQRRLDHNHFVLNFAVESKAQKDVVVRLFLGPQCEVDSCWNVHFRFYELDCYRHKLNEGLNVINWSTETSERYTEYIEKHYYLKKVPFERDYNIFKFPKNLAIPKGLNDGLNLTAFIIITEDIGPNESDFAPLSMYHKVYHKLDNKPLGFPFHKQVEFPNGLIANSAPNYKFFNISIYHESKDPSVVDYFSPQLY